MTRAATTYLFCKATIKRETDKAYLLTITHISNEPIEPEHTGWFPISQINKTVTNPDGTVDYGIPDWILDQKGLL